MFPYFEVLWLKLYMTGIGIVVFLITFIVVAKYLCNKWHQDFLKFFYWLPFAIFLTYFFGSYFQFILDVGFIPNSLEQIKILFSPYGYDFNYIGLLFGLVLSLAVFFRKIKRYENKRVWIDIMFLSLTLSTIPLWLFLVFGDNFIGKPSSNIFSLKPLTTESELNKFDGVYPIWIFVSLVSILAVLLVFFLKRMYKKFGYGFFGFIFLLISFGVIFLFQQYPRYGIMSVFGITFDVKHYFSFLLIMFCLHLYYKREDKIKHNI